jgi:branched-chain amino acid transport system ATP-binding protein
MQTMASDGAGALRAENIVVRFQGLVAIAGASLALRRREIVGLIGPNGAGKTTLVNCLTGFQRPTLGRVVLGNVDTAGWKPEHFRRKGISRTFQAGRLFKQMSVVDNVEVAGVGLGLSRRRAFENAMVILDWIGLADKTRASAASLPYTDERRLGIARALAMHPTFILLDEPAAGMSDAECEELNRCIREIPEKFGCGILLIEHNMGVIMGVCDRVCVLDGGIIIAEGTPDEIQQNQVVIDAYLGVAP